VSFPVFLLAQKKDSKAPKPPKVVEETVVYRTFDYLSDKEQVYQDRVKIGSRVEMNIFTLYITKTFWHYWKSPINHSQQSLTKSINGRLPPLQMRRWI
jgi:hypothetical protein